MTNDARSKLRSMGGIMASSPELMQVAQKFQVGGPVAPQPPMLGQPPFPPRPMGGPMSLNRAMGSPSRPMMPPLSGTTPITGRESPASRTAVGGGGISMADWRTMSRQERKRAGLPVSEIGAQLFFDRFGVGMGLVEPDALYTSEGPVGVDDLLETTRSPIDETDDARAARGFGRSAARSGLDGPVVNLPQGPSLIRPEEKSKEALLEEVRRERQVLEESQPVPGTYRSSSEKRQAEKLAEKERRLVSQVQSDEDIQTSREETVMEQPLVPKKLDQSVIDKMLDLAKKDPNVPFGTETPTPDGDQTPTADGDTPTGDQAPPKQTKRDLRSRYNEKLELFKEIYGTDDKDEARDRAMSLAMIGLAIAAGQSPNALTNIAQGAMVGLQGMGAQREAERERERGLKTLALETAIDQQQAETEAEAEAAKMDLEQRNRLAVARIRAAGGTGSSYTPERLRQQAIDKILADPYAYPSLMDEETQTIDPDKLKIYVDRIVAVESPTAPTAPELDELTDEERALLGG